MANEEMRKLILNALLHDVYENANAADSIKAER
jgi:hypothetical protein